LVSKKLGNAVKRNKIKRIIREIIRSYTSNHPPYNDILIQPQSGIENKKYKEIASCIENWKKTQIII
jgi:ribonuclease P protein component